MLSKYVICNKHEYVAGPPNLKWCKEQSYPDYKKLEYNFFEGSPSLCKYFPNIFFFTGLSKIFAAVYFRVCSTGPLIYSHPSAMWQCILSGRTRLKTHSEENQTYATCVILYPIGQEIWGDIWKHTVQKRQTNVTSVIIHPLVHTIWGPIWKHTVEKLNKCNQCDFASSQF